MNKQTFLVLVLLSFLTNQIAAVNDEIIVSPKTRVMRAQRKALAELRQALPFAFVRSGGQRFVSPLKDLTQIQLKNIDLLKCFLKLPKNADCLVVHSALYHFLKFYSNFEVDLLKILSTKIVLNLFLGIPIYSNNKVIDRAFRKFALAYHPDRNNNDPEKTELLKQVAALRGTLKELERLARRSRNEQALILRPGHQQPSMGKDVPTDYGAMVKDAKDHVTGRLPGDASRIAFKKPDVEAPTEAEKKAAEARAAVLLANYKDLDDDQ